MTTVPTRKGAAKGLVANERSLLTLDEAAERLGTTRRYAERLIEERRITYVKLGSGKRSPVRIPEKVLNAFIAAHTVQAAE